MQLLPATCTAQPLLPRRTYLVSELNALTARLTAVAAVHPSWPVSRVRATVARELDISTVTLRYMLTKAAEL